GSSRVHALQEFLQQIVHCHHPLPQEGGVDSTLKCNGIEVEEYFVGGEVAEAFARPLIEQVLDGLKFSTVMVLKSRARGKNWRSRPLKFSLQPRCQGLWGSAK